MTQSKLPIGLQDFRTLREEGRYYVDKTAQIGQLVSEGRNYFLTRPRRFGKSLLVDTLKSLFEGSEELFRGLDIHGRWDWSVTNPVLLLSFTKKYKGRQEIEEDMIKQLEAAERKYGLDPATTSNTGPLRLRNTLERLHRATGKRVVVLVDDYDKPALDVLHNPELAAANWDYLSGLYGMIKGSFEHIRFTFVTGVSTICTTRALLSCTLPGQNNLLDISLSRRFAAICGFTEDELDRVFRSELDGLDREQIRSRYNGYHWRGGERVYNPHDVLLLLRDRKFHPYWFEAGSPDPLLQMLSESSTSLPDLENKKVSCSSISRLEIENIRAEVLLFQTGYFTIIEEQEDHFGTLYRLNYPNPEVKRGLNQAMLEYQRKLGLVWRS